MTATTATGDQGFRVGRVLGETFRVLGSNLPAFLAIALLLVAPVYLALALSGSAFHAEEPESASDFIALFAETLLSFMAQAAVVYGTFRQLQGRRASLVETVTTGLRKMLPVLLVSIAAGLLTLLGFALLVVPGLIVMTVYWVAVPAAVVENLGVGASLNRSAALTKGCRWRVFGLILVTLALQIGAESAVGLLIAIEADTAMFLVAAWLVSGATTALYAVLATVSYRELRRAKDGAEVDEIAAVFD